MRGFRDEYITPVYDEHKFFNNSVSKECKYCGADNLWWQMLGSWTLCEEDGSVHVCLPTDDEIVKWGL